MFNINDFIENYNDMNNQEKLSIIRKSIVDKKVIDYLSSKFNNLQIEILGRYNGKLLDLMHQGKLEGWCWQTTETAILFMEDDDYIERGNININNGNYYHSWIVFKYDDKEYVLDPCLNLLCKKELYEKILSSDAMAQIPAKIIKEYFINYITNPPIREYLYSAKALEITNRLFGNKKSDEIVIHDKEDVHAPMYRNGAGYTTELENGIIKKLKVHYYYTEG